MRKKLLLILAGSAVVAVAALNLVLSQDSQANSNDLLVQNIEAMAEAEDINLINIYKSTGSDQLFCFSDVYAGILTKYYQPEIGRASCRERV